MNNKSHSVNIKSILVNACGWLVGIIVFSIGIVNTFWGNDPGFGLFLIVLSSVFLPPVNVLIKNVIGFSIPWLAKIALAVFIIWASVGVGELFDKIDLMMADLK